MDEARFEIAVKEAVKVIMELDKMLELRIKSIRKTESRISTGS